MSKAGKRVVGVIVLVTLLISAEIINLFVYPFHSAKPNFADVERVFNKIQVPADWVEVSSSENRGIAGRACPIESETACFHKGSNYTIEPLADTQAIKLVFESSGCQNVSSVDHEVIAGDPYTSFECSIDGLTVSGDVDKTPGDVWKVSIYVSS